MRVRRLIVVGAVAAVGFVGIGVLGANPSEGRTSAKASVIDTNGNTAGEVRLHVDRSKMTITARIQLPPEFRGFHGFHIHAVGVCDPKASPTPFATAGGHLGGAQGQTHSGHDGDLPSLLVNSDGTANLSFPTDRVTLSKLFDADGSAVMIHVGPDNYANIPARYAPNGPDQMTKDTGDSGGRLACGVIR